ncbi:hypothetical protein L2E82_06003 [Cichorium intybus]|uniref:Uncharacterized protein n=1 Tax=Cichorium intybus TaxID=13427 RepID=A0ACB9H9L1_CICIN|nr:hypothetical protein L2E82_06003 [Cichorium intybus]
MILIISTHLTITAIDSDSDFCFVKTGEMETSSMNNGEETSISCFNPPYLCVFQMPTLKSANKELKGMMKTVKIQDIDNLQDEMMDMMDISNEIQESLGRSYSVPDDIDEDKLMGELDALEVDMGKEGESEGIPSDLQPDNEPDLNEELNLPQAPSGHAVPAGRVNNHVNLLQAVDEFGFPVVPHASLRS